MIDGEHTVTLTAEHIKGLYLALDALHYAQLEICSLYLDSGRNQDYYDNVCYKQAGKAGAAIGKIVRDLKLERLRD